MYRTVRYLDANLGLQIARYIGTGSYIGTVSGTRYMYLPHFDKIFKIAFLS